MITMRDYAAQQHVSYEAIRAQVLRYNDVLRAHITIRNRTKFLDDWAVDFLNSKRAEHPVTIVNAGREEEIAKLAEQVELLTKKLLSAQERIIDLQASEKEMLEMRVRHELLSEDYKRLTADLEKKQADMERKQSELDQKQADLDRTHEDLTQTQANLLQTQTQLRLAEIDRDAARAEANSFQKSWFGFYRKT